MEKDFSASLTNELISGVFPAKYYIIENGLGIRFFVVALMGLCNVFAANIHQNEYSTLRWMCMTPYWLNVIFMQDATTTIMINHN